MSSGWPEPDALPELLVKDYSSVTLRAPRSIRDTFKLLQFLTDGGSIDDVLARVDFAGKSPADIYHAVLARPPEALLAASTSPEDFDARTFFKGALLSPEFQQRSVALFLNAYPELKRSVFIHIPRCAGTDLNLNIARRHASVAQVLEHPEMVPPGQMLLALGNVVRIADLAGDVLYYGHIHFDGYRAALGVRPTDRFFTVIRDPVDQVVSSVSFIVRILCNEPESPSARYWFAVLGCDESLVDKESPREIALRILLNEELTRRNLICTFLGNGTAADALTNLVVCDFDVTDITRYGQWLVDRWGVTSTSRFNRTSEPAITRMELGRHLDYVMAITDQDRIVHETVARALAATASASVRGAGLARHVDPRDLG